MENSKRNKSSDVGIKIYSDFYDQLPNGETR